MPQFHVNQTLCRRDGICAEVCPARIIKGKPGEFPQMRENFEESCINCGQCVAFCPHAACSVDTLPQDQVRPVQRKLLPSAESTDMLCKSRRSIRMYKETQVPKDILLELLDTARYAPSAKNMQSLRWQIVYERSRIKELGDLLAQWFANIATASATPNAEEAKMLAASWRRGGDPLFRGAPHLVLAVAPKAWAWAPVDSAIALTFLELAAHSRGIGCCWAGYMTAGASAHAPLQQALGIGADEVTVGGMMVGYPSLRPAAIPPRKPLQVEWV